MKIKLEHYNHIKRMIAILVANVGQDEIAKYKESLKLDKRVKILDKRFIWDLFYAAELAHFACNELYDYLHDEHIYTALKKIQKELVI